MSILIEANCFKLRKLWFISVFLAASKAFDRIFHMKLFEKLIERKAPMYFVRLLKHWYKEQTMQIKWGKHLSDPFHVTNGVRRGQVLLVCCIFK